MRRMEILLSSRSKSAGTERKPLLVDARLDSASADAFPAPAAI